MNKIVVFDDGETWCPLESCILMTLTDEGLDCIADEDFKARDMPSEMVISEEDLSEVLEEGEKA